MAEINAAYDLVRATEQHGGARGRADGDRASRAGGPATGCCRRCGSRWARSC